LLRAATPGKLYSVESLLFFEHNDYRSIDNQKERWDARIL